MTRDPLEKRWAALRLEEFLTDQQIYIWTTITSPNCVPFGEIVKYFIRQGPLNDLAKDWKEVPH